MDEEVNRINEDLPNFKRIRNLQLLSEGWTAETGELTPTLKARREVIFEKYRITIETLYEQGARL